MEEVLSVAKKAVQFDQQGLKEPAAYYYREASNLLELLCQNKSSGPDQTENWHLKAQQYIERAGQLDLQSNNWFSFYFSTLLSFILTGFNVIYVT